MSDRVVADAVKAAKVVAAKYRVDYRELLAEAWFGANRAALSGKPNHGIAFASARNAAIDQCRRESRYAKAFPRYELLPDEIPIRPEPDGIEFPHWLTAADREIIRLRYVLGMSVEETAAAVATTPRRLKERVRLVLAAYREFYS